MKINEVTGAREAHLSLLMKADEDEMGVREYLDDGWLFAAEESGQVVGVALYVAVDPETMELKNIAFERSISGKRDRPGND